MGLLAPSKIANIWYQSIQVRNIFISLPLLMFYSEQQLLLAQKQLARVSDKRLYWLKEQYLKLYFENDPCSKPKPAEAIKVNDSKNTFHDE